MALVEILPKLQAFSKIPFFTEEGLSYVGRASIFAVILFLVIEGLFGVFDFFIFAIEGWSSDLIDLSGSHFSLPLLLLRRE